MEGDGRFEAHERFAVVLGKYVTPTMAQTVATIKILENIQD